MSGEKKKSRSVSVQALGAIACVLFLIDASRSGLLDS